MKKERLFYLDFIRAIATVLIVITHFNALYLYNVPTARPDMAILSMNIANIYIGSFGVTLFLIVSGASLMHVYGDKDSFDAKRFYKKRFLTLYPMFWIAYLFVFLYSVYRMGALPSVPKWRILFSVLGLDGLLANYNISTFYLVGEWFLGCILLIYLLFPLLLYLMKKIPRIFLGIVLAVYILGLLFDGLYVSVPIRIPEIVFGMYFIKYIKKVNWYTAAIAFAVLVANTIVAPPFHQAIQTTYVGICAFLVLVYLSQFLQYYPIKRVCATVCKYSYACFLCHHYLTYQIALKWDLSTIGYLESCLLFLYLCIIIAIVSYLLHHLTDRVVLYVQSLFQKPKES